MAVAGWFVLAGGIAAEVFGDWAVDCAATERCMLTQALVSKRDDFVALTKLLPTPDDGPDAGARLDIAVPAGVHLASGIFVASGKPEPRQLEWQRCNAQLCVASALLSADEMQAWRRANATELRYRPTMGADVVEITISLMGLTAGLRHAEQKARAE